VRIEEWPVEERGSGPDGIVYPRMQLSLFRSDQGHEAAYRLEARFFERLFDTPASRVAYIPDGSPACTYEFPVAMEEV